MIKVELNEAINKRKSIRKYINKEINTVKKEDLNEFNTLLTEYYDTNNMKKIENFIYDKCIFGLEIITN